MQDKRDVALFPNALVSWVILISRIPIPPNFGEKRFTENGEFSVND